MPKYKEPTQKQLEFVRWYTSPASPTYDNVMQSAIRAGYSRQYASKTAHKTLKPIAKKMVIDKVAEKTTEGVDRGQFYADLLRDAENGIAERTRMDTKGDVKLIQIQQKEQQFVAERIGKREWSTKDQDEKAGLVAINGDTLQKLADTLANLSSGNSEPIKADYIIDNEPRTLPNAENEDE